MTIATQSGGLIVKDGKLAENCGCCGGWHCYPDTNPCPCFYAKAMPNALNAQLDFTLSNTIYGAAMGNFAAATIQCTRLTPAQASTISGAYSLSRRVIFGQPSCDYSYSSENLTIQVRVGQSCNFGEYTVSLTGLAFTVPAMAPVWPGPDAYSGPINSQCAGVPGFLTNAASRSYGENITLFCPQGGFTNFCSGGGPFRFYSISMALGASPSGRDNPPCSPGVIEEIDHQWAIDILYTDTAGASPQLGTVSRAITLSVTE
jgi:hypothetical protein